MKKNQWFQNYPPMRRYINHHFHEKEPETNESVIVQSFNETVPELISAVRKHNIELVSDLISKGTDFNEKEMTFKRTGLHEASALGYNDIVSMLLDKGADVNGLASGWTPLMEAAIKGHYETIIILLQNGADVTSKEPIKGRMSHHIMAIKGHSKLIEPLVTNGADLNWVDRDFHTALELAILNKKVEMIKELSRLTTPKANLTLTDAAYLAVRMNCLDCLKPIIEAVNKNDFRWPNPHILKAEKFFFSVCPQISPKSIPLSVRTGLRSYILATGGSQGQVGSSQV